MSQLEAPQHKYGTARSVLLQFTSILCMANGGIASAALKSYTDDRNTAASYGSVLTNTDAQAGAALTITAGALVGSLLVRVIRHTPLGGLLGSLTANFLHISRHYKTSIEIVTI